MKKFTLFLLTLAIIPYGLIANEKTNDDSTVNIVYQCDFPEPDRIHLMLNTINNVVENYNKNLIPYEIDIVALGPCLQYVMNDFTNTGFEEKPYITKGGPTGEGTRSRLKALQAGNSDNIKIYACRNTMQKNNVTDAQIEKFASVTPAGIVKIIDLQRKGYSYIKIK